MTRRSAGPDSLRAQRDARSMHRGGTSATGAMSATSVMSDTTIRRFHEKRAARMAARSA
ncbi:calcium-binding protein [Burkholderia pseudomallei]|uniref:calcium-binding protein n=1 Tax=Burkholderia pseudomallei TaxID=28450 RepID=UPI0009CD6502|nr:calcium-binding protein [Burkholderia pseudomallei]MDS1026615.1 calcium-binding protein [Burkholderia pseudomallei]OMV66666.1 calcium-binding protein [Burkholderia pseudomallei]OMV74536.1 calcium-binding protein [Burkholderia pseudomallei]OMV90962.1 calcium-binding protein [Burkholderia pseudomallei]